MGILDAWKTADANDNTQKNDDNIQNTTHENKFAESIDKTNKKRKTIPYSYEDRKVEIESSEVKLKRLISIEEDIAKRKAELEYKLEKENELHDIVLKKIGSKVGMVMPQNKNNKK